MTDPPSASTSSGQGAVDHALGQLRIQIEQVDQLIVQLLARRLQLARDTGAIKRAAALPVADPDREQVVLQRVGELARAEGISDADVRRLFSLVIEMAREAQIDLDGLV